MKITIEIEVDLVDTFDNNNNIARVHYPNEGNKILITKGLNTIELSKAIHHEIGHIIDWYLSSGEQSKDMDIREVNADIIGESIRYKTEMDSDREQKG